MHPVRHELSGWKRCSAQRHFSSHPARQDGILNAMEFPCVKAGPKSDCQTRFVSNHSCTHHDLIAMPMLIEELDEECIVATFSLGSDKRVTMYAGEQTAGQAGDRGWSRA